MRSRQGCHRSRGVRSWLITGAAAAILALGAGRAVGLAGVHVETPTLQPPTTLPAPQVPQLPQTPQLPSTSAPSLPSAPSAPSAPSLPSTKKVAGSAPSTSGGSGSGTGSGQTSAPASSG